MGGSPPWRYSDAMHSLPKERTPFFGREAQLEQVRSALDSGGIVTLIGPGGMGKTRLALHCAYQADDAVFVDLSACVTARDAVHATATALGLPSLTDDIEERIAEDLGPAPAAPACSRQR